MRDRQPERRNGRKKAQEARKGTGGLLGGSADHGESIPSSPTSHGNGRVEVMEGQHLPLDPAKPATISKAAMDRKIFFMAPLTKSPTGRPAVFLHKLAPIRDVLVSKEFVRKLIFRTSALANGRWKMEKTGLGLGFAMGLIHAIQIGLICGLEAARGWGRMKMGNS